MRRRRDPSANAGITRRSLLGAVVLAPAVLRAGVAIASAAAGSFTVSEIAYAGASAPELTASFYRPAGAGPFPLLVYVHGGAWTMGDRSAVAAMAAALAADGIGSFCVDFRMPPDYPYPESIADLNLAVRFVKANAHRFATRAAWVGLIGESSGGHQAVLAAMRPADSRYTRYALPAAASVSARVSYVVSLWGVLDPLARYQMAKSRGNASMVRSHLAYWGEAAMAEGNPQMIIERGESFDRPAMLVVYGTGDQNVDFHIPHRFVQTYQRAGGAIEAQEYPGAAHGFIRPPFDPTSEAALSLISQFIHAHAHG